MTYLFKLARRIASALVAASVVGLAACSDPAARDFLEPNPATPTTPSSLASLRIASHPGTVNFADYHQFAAWGRTVAGDSVAVAVSWTSTGGEISPSGLFRGTATGTFTVKAFALAQPSLSVSSTITVGEGGSLFTGLKIIPEPVAIGGGMSVAFAATAKLVSNGVTTAPAVTWTTNGGSISPSGEFIGSTLPGTYQVTATTLDGKLTGTASVVIQDAWLTKLELSPKVVILPSGTSQVFEVKATWSDGSSYVPELEWLTAAGTVVAQGASGGNGNGGWQLNAGTSPGNYTVIARHKNSGKSDTAYVTVAPALAELRISPASTNLAPGASKGFTVTTLMSDGSTVGGTTTWTATGGTINGSGVYTAGSAAGSFRVIARTADGVLADTATVNISQPLANLQGLEISPRSGTVSVGGLLHFAASATWSDGSTALPPVVWSASGGSVTPEGRWTAPTSAGTYRVIVRNQAGTLADTAVMSVVVPPPSVATLKIAPKTASAVGGQSLAFSASVTWTGGGTTLPPLQWSATGGQISQNGTWVAPDVTGAFKVVVKHAGGTLADTASVSVTTAPRVTAIKISPGLAATSTGKTVQFTAAATWNDGVTRPMTFIWTALGGIINTSGLFTAGSLAGQFLVTATCTGCAVTDTVAVTVIESESTSSPVTLTSLVLNPSSMTLSPGEQRTLTPVASWSDGGTSVPSLTWDATGGTLNGLVYTAGSTAGSYRIIVRQQGGTKADTTAVTIQAAAVPPPPTGSIGDLVVFPNEAIEFIIGPQLKSGAASNPWPWFDQNLKAKGIEHGTNFPTTSADGNLLSERMYYDMGLVLYSAYYKTGDPALLAHARRVADVWWTGPAKSGTNTDFGNSAAPRGAALGALMLRAMDGRPEMWPWITAYSRHMYQSWLGARLNNATLHYGVRDGGYMLLYSAWLGKAHPDAAVRAEFRQKALDAATLYYARLQYPDGSWRWTDETAAGGGMMMQPFMVGLLLDGMVATHRLTGDARILTAITKSVENIYTVGYRGNEPVTQKAGATWRGMWYFVYGNDCASGCGRSTLDGGWDTNGIREVRQLSPTSLQAFGYAYKMTGQAQYRQWGDEVFAATFGKGQGPLADPYYSLADFRAKEFNAAYRSSGRYLAWRLGL